MPASLRMELFPANMARCLDFYTQVLRFKLLRHEDTYAFLQRDTILIGIVTDVPPHVPGQVIDVSKRKPPCGVEIVIEVDEVDEERDFVVKKIGEGESRMGKLEEDLVDRPWGLRDFRICDPDGYYLRITNHGHGKKSDS